jgi:hypothetical protein
VNGQNINQTAIAMVKMSALLATPVYQSKSSYENKEKNRKITI